MSSSKSFSSLLAADLRPTTTTTTRGLGDRIAERTGSGVPKFKSLPPLSFPISPPSLVSHSSYFSIPYGLSPAELLDSPVLLSASTILPSPTTGTFPLQAFNSQKQHNDINNEKNNFSDFSFQPQTKPPQYCETGDQTWDYQQPANQEEGVQSDEPNLKSDYNSMQSFSPEIATIQTNHQTNNTIQSEYNHSLHNSKSDDGYNWRKYGQKQVKGSENPRSYYKCTHPNCPTKKKVESSLTGQITEIVYRGSHNHPKPQSTRRSSSFSSVSSAVIQSHQTRSNDISEYYGSNGMGKMDSSVVTPENSSITVGDDGFEQSSHGGRLVEDDLDKNEPDAKRWKSESEGISAVAGLGRTVREPRVVVQTRSDIDILIDGYRWRKYGQKVVRGNPNPRSYYKCTNPGCPVRKHVERASHDAGAVITTYEGKHNHDVPAARGSSTGNNRSLSRSVPANPSYYTSIDTSLPPHNPNNPTPPYTLEMLHSPDSGYSIAKNEPMSDMFPDSFLC